MTAVAKTPDANADQDDDGIDEDTMRAPRDLVEMVRVIKAKRLNGWKSAAAVLNDPRCPLRDWLREQYEEAIKMPQKKNPKGGQP